MTVSLPLEEQALLPSPCGRRLRPRYDRNERYAAAQRLYEIVDAGVWSVGMTLPLAVFV